MVTNVRLEVSRRRKSNGEYCGMKGWMGDVKEDIGVFRVPRLSTAGGSSQAKDWPLP